MSIAQPAEAADMNQDEYNTCLRVLRAGVREQRRDTVRFWLATFVLLLAAAALIKSLLT